MVWDVPNPRYDALKKQRDERYDWAVSVDPDSVTEYHANVDSQRPELHTKS